ncbi:uncharacterized protein AB675_1068 [Cyphellophora attinorum]|uniref:Uncharacterized protein n=1 Tax=Cyphellophora attinorum TaxID=1664694 RepID=A0A0N1H8B6_9EURO|nr:uncharacterized protein AB675_1068 [Phialophora attinorum]KPI38117.1 hypothetical protein AB675_1068 [Phialophora attinorum]
MSTNFYGHQQPHYYSQNMSHIPHQHNHHGRSRRAPRLPAAARHHRQQKPQKEVVVPENPSLAAFRMRFEAGRSFDLDDDLEFCPNLLTFDEKQSVSSGSDRSSLSSGSPESSPLQQQIQPDHLSLSATSSAFISPSVNNNSLKVHQPSAIRSGTRAIPIVNPSTGIRIASPPNSISPGLMQTLASVGWGPQ